MDGDEQRGDVGDGRRRARAFERNVLPGIGDVDVLEVENADGGADLVDGSERESEVCKSAIESGKIGAGFKVSHGTHRNIIPYFWESSGHGADPVCEARDGVRIIA